MRSEISEADQKHNGDIGDLRKRIKGKQLNNY
jgi:hypothetical protein